MLDFKSSTQVIKTELNKGYFYIEKRISLVTLQKIEIK